MCSKIETYGQTTFMCIRQDEHADDGCYFINDTEPIADTATIHPRKPIGGGFYFLLAEFSIYLAIIFLIVAIALAPQAVA